MKIKLMADSTCDLSEEVLNRYNISLAPLVITIDGKEYKATLSTNIKEVTAGAEYNLNSIFSYESYNGKNKEFSFTINMDSTLKTSASIEETITDSVKYADLTEEQMQEIYTNIMNIIAKETGQY